MVIPPSLVAANVTERLAKLEASSLADREVIAELGQKIARLESENRSMREWSSGRFMAMWETSNARDVNVVQALQNIHALQVEENARQIRIQQTAENLEVLLRMPALPIPMVPGQPPAQNPTGQDAGPMPDLPVFPPEDAEREIPVGESKKRGRSASSEASSKRPKL